MMLSKLSPWPFVGLFAIAALLPTAAGAQAADATVLMANSFAKVTRADYDAELLKLPVDRRAGFADNPRRVNDLLTRMLVQKSLAAQARAANLDAAPDTQRRLQLEVDRFLAQVMVDNVETKAAAEFDAGQAKYEARARELYALDRSRFELPEQFTATHILFDLKKQNAETAQKLAQDTRAKIAAGGDMGKLAKELSDDPSASVNSGKLDWFATKEMDAAFGAAVASLRNPGELSAPVLSQFGWHVIRLDGRRPPGVQPYEQARVILLGELKKRHIDDRREEAIAAVRRDPKTDVNRAAVDALTPKIDIEAAKRALGLSPGAAPVAPK